MTTPKPIESLDAILYPYFYGFMIRDVWAKGGKEMLSSEEKTCRKLTHQATQAIERYITEREREARLRL